MGLEKVTTDSNVSYKNNKYPVSNYHEAIEKVIEIINKTQQIQRYKGLGEMNPSQLWETTMNKKNRRMLKIRIQNDEQANSIFSILMGDNVESRKKFIKDNSLSVNNLD